MKQFDSISAGLVLFIIFAANVASAQTCTGSGPVGSATGTNNSSVGTFAWSGTGNTAALDATYATAAPVLTLLGYVNTEYLQVAGFGFTIPNTNTICGVTATISRGNTALISLNQTITDYSLVLVKGGTPIAMGLTGANHASGTAWPSGSIGTANYGNSTDGWASTWLPSDINNSGFGIALSAHIAGLISLIPVAAVDQITVTVYSSPPTSLAIDLVNFTVQGETSGNVLNWTANTTGVAGSFIVQRSADGTNWQKMTTVNAEIGEDSYSYTDATPLGGETFYRLEVLNLDGSVAGYSVIAAVAGRTLTTVRTYPNPFTDMINITSPNNFSRVILRDALGRTLQVREYGSGVNNAQLNAASLPAGLYFVQVDAAIYKLIKN
jgi:hypothetical protein